MGKFKDLTGMKFGRLTIIKRAEDYVSPSGEKKVQWLCECSCENKTRIIVIGSNLTKRNTESCGCLAKEKTIKRNKSRKRYNQYDLSGEYGIGYTSKGEKFYFDLEDYDKIKDYCWHTKFLGSYDSFEDAVTARKTAEDKYFGEFSYDNSVKKE